MAKPGMEGKRAFLLVDQDTIHLIGVDRIEF
jgi:hypothetical protein